MIHFSFGRLVWKPLVYEGHSTMGCINVEAKCEFQEKFFNGSECLFFVLGFCGYILALFEG
jgi:hypothetical protein